MRYAIIIALALLALEVYSQGDLPSEEIEVIKDFDARLIEARKTTFTPELPATDTTRREFNYELSSVVPPIQYVDPTIRPLAFQGVTPPTNYRGYARAGYGTPNQILGDVFYQAIDNESTQIGIDLSHQSANNKDIANQRFMDNDIRLNGQWQQGPAMTVFGKTGYSFDDYYYYAEDPNEPNPDFNKRRYKTFDISGGIMNSEELDNGWSYRGSVDFMNHKDDQGSTENNIAIRLNGEKSLGRHSATLDVVADFTSLNEISTRNLNNYIIIPSFTFRKDRINVKGGVEVALSGGDVFFFPEIETNWSILDTRIVAHAGATGGLQKNNFYNLSTFNPYIATRLDSLINTRNTDFRIGASGQVKWFSYEGHVHYTISRDMALFLPDGNDARTFQPLFDDVNTIALRGTLQSEPLPGLEAGVTLSKMFYSTSEEEEAWHLPGFEGSLFARYSMLDGRLKIRLESFLRNGIHYIRDDRSVDTLDGIFDVSIGADWFFSERFGLFAHVNNITGNRGQRWQRYPSFGFNALGGILVRF